MNNKMLTAKDFIVFGEDFNRHPHALEHILRPLFKNNRFLWVETIGLRSPKFSFYDFKRIIEKIKKWLFQAKNKSSLTHPENVVVLTPFMIPYNQFSIIRRFNRWNVLRQVQRALSLLDMKNPISISSVPNACDYIGGFGESLKIYYCVDEFSLWPGLDLSLVKKLEEKLISKTDLVVATSDSLSKTKTLPGRTTPVITHGVEFSHFNIGAKESFHSPLKLCYFGLFDERSDQELIREILTAIPDCELYIFGDVICDTKRLQTLKNIKFLGKIDYKKLPDAIQSMDMFLLPYCRNELTDNINPLKLKEYLSTGRSVIATDLPEVVKLKDYLFIGRTSQEFIDLIQAIRTKELAFDSAKVLSYVKRNETWEAKALLFSNLIIKKLQENHSSSFLMQ